MMNNYSVLINNLGFNSRNGLHLFAENKWKKRFPKRVEEVIEHKLKPYAIYELNDEPFILFFDAPQKPEIHKWCWNVNSSPIVIIHEENQIKIYNGFSFDNKKELLNLLLESEKNLDDFNYLNLVSGKFLEKYGSKFKESNQVDYKLLENIDAARNILINEHRLEPSVVNSLIGRLLFVRYLIDRGVKLGTYGSLSKNDLLDILSDRDKTYGLFYYLRDKFNGNLFPIDEEKEPVVTEPHLDIFVKLFKGHELKSGQMNLFDFYDFSVIPIEFVSNIYEFFLGSDSQRKKGAYYTPPFLVDYILKETVDAYFTENPRDFQCKVLDPACGSGIFLVETLRRLIHRYHELNPNCKEDKETYREQLIELLCVNIFGVDIDENAVNVAVFSLYITLLDYLEPKDIENFRFPILMGRNFFVNDFFDLEAGFNAGLEESNFDFIVGNPPWGNLSGEGRNTNYVLYCEQRGVKIGRKEISQAFLYRVADFSTVGTKISLIVTSKNLYNINEGSKSFRKYILNNFKVDKIFELSSVRRQVFSKSRAFSESTSDSIAPPSIIFYRHAPGENTDDNLVKHISMKPNHFFDLFNIFVIEKFDYKEVLQKYFKQYDWLFKVLVYGNILDFYLIKRLKESYPIINKSIIENTKDFLTGQGIMVGGGDRNDVGDLLEKPYVNTKKDLKPFYVELNTGNVWKTKYVHRVRDKELYNGNSLIMAEGLLSDLRAKASYLPQKAVYKSSITAIHARKPDARPWLRILTGLFNSSLFAYFIMMTGSSAAIEREQTHDIEKFQFPFISNRDIGDIVEKIEQNREAYYRALARSEKELKPDPEVLKNKEKEYPDLVENLDKKILTLFELSGQESSLVDYVRDVSIPLFNRKNIKRLFKEAPKEWFQEYALLFIDHFKKYFDGPDNYFSAEIYRGKYAVGINFQVTGTKPETTITWVTGSDDLTLVERLSNISFSKVSNDLFIQKDIKGFEENSFYVIKPNQYKLWHKAIAYLDLNEFTDAILRAGKKRFLE